MATKAPVSQAWTAGGSTNASGGLGTFQGSPGGAAGGAGQNPDAANVTDQPIRSWINPVSSPATWGYDQNTDSQQLYVGSTSDQHISQLSPNVLVGNIAQRLGLKPVKGQSKEEQIIAFLAPKYGISQNGSHQGQKGLSRVLAIPRQCRVRPDRRPRHRSKPRSRRGGYRLQGSEVP